MSNPPQWTALPPRLLPGSPSLLFIPISSFSPFYFPILQSSDTGSPCFPLIRPWCADCTNARHSIPEQDSCVHTKPPPLRRPSPRPPGSFPPRLSLSPFTPPPLYSAHPSSLLASSAGHASLSALCKHGALVRARTWPAFTLFTLAEGIGGTPAVLRKRKHVLNGCLRDSRGDVSGARAGPSRVRPHARASQGQKKKKRKGETNKQR